MGTALGIGVGIGKGGAKIAPPAPPTNLAQDFTAPDTGSPGWDSNSNGGGVAITFTPSASPGVTSYKLYSGGFYTGVSATGSPLNLTAQTADSQPTLTITAVGPGGESVPSAALVGVVAPSAPMLMLTDNGDQTVTIAIAGGFTGGVAPWSGWIQDLSVTTGFFDLSSTTPYSSPGTPFSTAAANSPYSTVSSLPFNSGDLVTVQVSAYRDLGALGVHLGPPSTQSITLS